MSNAPHGDLAVCGGRSHPKLISDICRLLDIPQTPIEFKDFSNGNMKVIIRGDVRNRDVFVIQSGARGGIDNRFFTQIKPARQAEIFNQLIGMTDSLKREERQFTKTMLNIVGSFSDLSSLLCNRDLMELLIIIDALRSASADRITVVMPYMFYVRSDKKEEGRISVTAKLVAQLLELAGADRALVMDLHASQIQSFFDIRTDQIFAESLFFEFIRQQKLRDFVVVTGDEGNVKPSHRMAKLLDASSIVVIHKMRWDDNETADVLGVQGNVKGKVCLLHDDETLTGGTLVPGIEALNNAGAKAIFCFLSHFIASNGAIQRLVRSPISRLVTTDTIPLVGKVPKKVVIQNTAPMFSRAIRKIHEGDSIGDLIKQCRIDSLNGN